MDGQTGVTCDRCNARAFVVFTKGDDRLDFCLHHTHEHSAALRDLGYLRRTLARDCEAKHALGHN